MSGLEKHWNQQRCTNCDYDASFHDKERVYPEKGPAGSYHYKYTDCPKGRGTYKSPLKDQ